MGLLDYIFPKKIESGVATNWEVKQTESGQVRMRPAVEPQKRSIYSPDDPSAVARIASRYLVEVLPGSATRDEHQLWFMFWRDMAKLNVEVMKGLTGLKSTDYGILRDVKQVTDEILSRSSTWEKFLGGAMLPVTVGLKFTLRQMRSLIIYGFEVADAGWGAHMADMPETLMAAGTMTAAELEADYLKRLGMYQAIFHLLTDQDTRFLLGAEDQSGVNGGHDALGLEPFTALIILAVVSIVAIAFVVYSYLQLVETNALYERQMNECHRAFIATGQESKLCKALPKELNKALADNPANILAEQLTKYALIAGGVVLTVMFLPEIMASVRAAQAEGRAVKRHEQAMAKNRRRRLRR